MLLVDDFVDTVAVGSLVGRAGRSGRDVEGLLGADHGAARIRPPRIPHWGRAVLAYGPYRAEAGAACSFLVTNGHNASENEERWPSLVTFLSQVVRGTQVDPPLSRVLARIRHRDHSRDPLWRRVRTVRTYGHEFDAGRGDADNLAVGWFAEPAPTGVSGGPPALLVRSAGPLNGTLSVTGGQRPALVRPLWNVPVQYVSVVLPGAVLLCAASLGGTAGLAPPGFLRPLHLAPSAPEGGAAGVGNWWAGVSQRLLGQVGWGIDTRIHGARVARLGAGPWREWCGPAHVADRLGGPAPAGAQGSSEDCPGEDCPGEARCAERGGHWQAGPGGATVVDPGAPSGLVHAVVTPAQDGEGVDLLVRASADAALVIRLTTQDTAVVVRTGDVETVLATGAAAITAGVGVAVAVTDDGDVLAVRAGGADVLDVRLDAVSATLAGTGVGWGAPSAGAGLAAVRDLQAYPCVVACPPELAHHWPAVRLGTRVVLDSPFSGSSDDLDGYLARSGQRWSHRSGGAFRLEEHGAVVVPPAVVVPATANPRSWRERVTAPSGQRTAYVIDWEDPGFADVEVDVVNPGSARGEGHDGRVGLLFEQDDDHALLVNLYLNDIYDGSSISCFLRIGGYEEVYDAVWNNVGRRVTWGGANQLRVAFDGNTWTAHLDGELVLHRRLVDVYPTAAPWRVNRVGVMANWEFGEDTGSTIRSVTGRVDERVAPREETVAVPPIKRDRTTSRAGGPRRAMDAVGRYALTGVRDAVKLRERRTDRYLLEEVIFPALITDPAVGSVLFVGTAPYTRDYERLFGDTAFTSIDVDAKQAAFGSSDHIIGSIVEIEDLVEADTFDALLMNGVIGFGLNELAQAEKAFEGVHRVLRPGGRLVLGWNEVAPYSPFSPEDIVALRKFLPEPLPPFTMARYPTYSPLRHVYDFYRKPS